MTLAGKPYQWIVHKIPSIKPSAGIRKCLKVLSTFFHLRCWDSPAQGPMQRSKCGEHCYFSHFIFQACLNQRYLFETLYYFLPSTVLMWFRLICVPLWIRLRVTFLLQMHLILRVLWLEKYQSVIMLCVVLGWTWLVFGFKVLDIKKGLVHVFWSDWGFKSLQFGLLVSDWMKEPLFSKL